MRLVPNALRSLPQWVLLACACAATALASGAILYYAYVESRAAARDAASAVFIEASGRIDQEIESFLGRATSLARVGAAAPSGAAPIPEDGRAHPAYKVLLATVEPNRSTYAAYYGHADGGFVEVIAVRGSPVIARALKAPAGA